MTASLKLVSLNIERHKHLDRVGPFLAKQKPDVFCVQEVFEHDIALLMRAAGATHFTFEAMTMRSDELQPGIMGLAILSKFPIIKRDVLYYSGERTALPTSLSTSPKTYNYANRMVLAVDIDAAEVTYTVATTHFKWTPDGRADDGQRRDVGTLLGILDSISEFVIAGDFNAPRGGEIFGAIASKYKDNVPLKYKTSLDISLHREGKRKPEELADKMVDGIFSTPSYVVSDVEMICGVSDHCALIANASRAS